MRSLRRLVCFYFNKHCCCNVKNETRQCKDMSECKDYRANVKHPIKRRGYETDNMDNANSIRRDSNIVRRRGNTAKRYRPGRV